MIYTSILEREILIIDTLERIGILAIISIKQLIALSMKIKIRIKINKKLWHVVIG
jgi:hypothetical protein